MSHGYSICHICSICQGKRQPYYIPTVACMRPQPFPIGGLLCIDLLCEHRPPMGKGIWATFMSNCGLVHGILRTAFCPANASLQSGEKMGHFCCSGWRKWLKNQQFFLFFDLRQIFWFHLYPDFFSSATICGCKRNVIVCVSLSQT